MTTARRPRPTRPSSPSGWRATPSSTASELAGAWAQGRGAGTAFGSRWAQAERDELARLWEEHGWNRSEGVAAFIETHPHRAKQGATYQIDRNLTRPSCVACSRQPLRQSPHRFAGGLLNATRRASEMPRGVVSSRSVYEDFSPVQARSSEWRSRLMRRTVQRKLMVTRTHTQLVRAVAAAERAPESPDDLARWLKGGEHLELLRQDAERDELIVAALSSGHTVINSYVAPANLPELGEDILPLYDWSPNPFHHTAVSYSWVYEGDQLRPERRDEAKWSRPPAGVSPLVFFTCA